jgi:hypothetical protein
MRCFGDIQHNVQKFILLLRLVTMIDIFGASMSMKLRVFKCVLIGCCLLSQFGAIGQIATVRIEDKTIGKLIDTFSEEVNALRDSLKVDIKNQGVISINLYNAGYGLFPLDISLERAGDISNYEAGISQELQITMVFDGSFFWAHTPSVYSFYNGKHVVFFTGLEWLTERTDKRLAKKLQRELPFEDRVMVSWIVRIDHQTKEIEVVNKRVHF